MEGREQKLADRLKKDGARTRPRSRLQSGAGRAQHENAQEREREEYRHNRDRRSMRLSNRATMKTRFRRPAHRPKSYRLLRQKLNLLEKKACKELFLRLPGGSAAMPPRRPLPKDVICAKRAELFQITLIMALHVSQARPLSRNHSDFSNPWSPGSVGHNAVSTYVFHLEWIVL